MVSAVHWLQWLDSDFNGLTITKLLLGVHIVHLHIFTSSTFTPIAAHMKGKHCFEDRKRRLSPVGHGIAD